MARHTAKRGLTKAKYHKKPTTTKFDISTSWEKRLLKDIKNSKK